MKTRFAAVTIVAFTGLSGIANRCPASVPAAQARTVAALVVDDPKPSDGKKTEEKVPVDQLPAAVVATVTKECPGGKITEAEKVTKKGKTYYSMDVKVGDVEYDVKTKLDGTFVSKKVDEEEADEKK